MVVAPDGIVLSGLDKRKKQKEGEDKSILGYMEKIDFQGNKVWGKSYHTPPGGLNMHGVGTRWNSPTMDGVLFTECWGIAPRYEDDLTTLAGYVMSCGLGIEGVYGAVGSPLYKEGTAYTNAMGTASWRALTLATDLEGNRVWSRIDSGQFASENGAPQETASSAGEWVIPLRDGGHAVISDE